MLISVLLALCAQAPPADYTQSERDSEVYYSSELPGGIWHAWLETPGGKLPFEIEVGIKRADLSSWKRHVAILNGGEFIRIEDEVLLPALESRHFGIAMLHYGSAITGEFSEDYKSMTGTWVKLRSGKPTELKFEATWGVQPRFTPRGDGPPIDFAGRWLVQFEKSDDPAVGIFNCDLETGVASGTFLTTLGDYRYLAGTVDEEGMRLSCFDGAHAFLFHATREEDGTLKGDFWSSGSWHESWTAKLDPDAALPDSFDQIQWIGERGPGSAGEQIAELEFRDSVTDSPIALGDPALAGKVRILSLFGTWCPNCNDEAQLWAELYEQYSDLGLQIIGLGFEATADVDQAIGQLRTFRERYGAKWPILLAADITDKQHAEKVFPFLSAVKSYPTAIFLDHKGAVRAIHSGFAGPATGDAHTKLREDYERLIVQLLAEADAAAGSSPSGSATPPNPAKD